jgi:hypothetical protein
MQTPELTFRYFVIRTAAFVTLTPAIAALMALPYLG